MAARLTFARTQPPGPEPKPAIGKANGRAKHPDELKRDSVEHKPKN